MNSTSRRTVPVLLAIATLVPIGTLGWLASRLVRQDREMEGQRRRESLEYAAGRVALALESRLSAIEEQLAQGHGVRITASGLEAADGAPILFQPHPAPPGTPATVFAEAEALEYQRHDLVGAATAYRRITQASEPAVRAAALVRLGRVLRNSGAREEALQTYDRLQQLGSVTVDGQPAALIARQARCRIYQQAGDTHHLREEVAGLQQALYSGHTAMDRVTFELYRDMLRGWGGTAPPADTLARTEAAVALWQIWRNGELGPRGRRILRTGDQPVLAVWTGGPDHPVAWLASPSEMQTALGPAWTTQHLNATFYDPDGQHLFGLPEPASSATLTPGEIRLPAILRLAFQPGKEPEGTSSSRRSLLVTGLSLTLALMLAAAYGLWRATTKEMALARQQSDFISAVSHEFRTPITSMRHLTDLLATNSVPSEERKVRYYELLARETERLHRMVESLLNFGRMQAGSYAWKLEPVDTAGLVRAAVHDFQREGQWAGREITCDVDDCLPPIHADQEALSRAVSNLLENAGKYSDPGTPIHVAAHRSAGAIRISVKDHGVGIPPEEQASLFHKFVRGSHARQAGIRGIGVGLALVKSVAEAHGGSVLLASQPGSGSTFTLVIPCQES